MGIVGWPMTGDRLTPGAIPSSSLGHRKQVGNQGSQTSSLPLRAGEIEEENQLKRYARHHASRGARAESFLSASPPHQHECDPPSRAQPALPPVRSYIYSINHPVFPLGPLWFLSTHFVLESSRAWCLFSSSPLPNVCPIAGRLRSPTILYITSLF